MPIVVAFKFSEQEMPRYFLPGALGHEDLHVQDFCVALREGEEDVGFVAALEQWSEYQVAPSRQIPTLIRRATEGEIERFWEVKALERRALLTCKEKVVEHGLPMKVSSCRFETRNNKLAFQFTSDKRVDFRVLVRDLAAILRCRIELWQIGVREEARAQDGFGVCGLRTCCSAWIRDFKPVTLKMAKEQDIDLPPSKLTGQCGRLLCCLAYEVEAYRDLAQQSFPRGTTVIHKQGRGVVVDRNLLRRQFIISDEQGTLSTIHATDIVEFVLPEQMKHMGKRILEGLEEEARKQADAEALEATESSYAEDESEVAIAIGKTDAALDVTPDEKENDTQERTEEEGQGQRSGRGRSGGRSRRRDSRHQRRPSQEEKKVKPEEKKDKPIDDKQKPSRSRRRGRGPRRGDKRRPPQEGSGPSGGSGGSS